MKSWFEWILVISGSIIIVILSIIIKSGSMYRYEGCWQLIVLSFNSDLDYSPLKIDARTTKQIYSIYSHLGTSFLHHFEHSQVIMNHPSFIIHFCLDTVGKPMEPPVMWPLITAAEVPRDFVEDSRQVGWLKHSLKPIGKQKTRWCFKYFFFWPLFGKDYHFD